MSPSARKVWVEIPVHRSQTGCLSVTFREVINRDLKVMDSTAFSLCKDNDMTIIVFNLDDPHNLVDVVCGKNIGTAVTN